MKAASRFVLWLAISTILACGLLMAAAAHAQTCPAKPTCDPVTERNRLACGAELKGVTATGQWRAWWYPVSKTPAEWKWCPFQWAMLDKYQPSNPAAVIAIVDAIKDAPDTTQAIMDALTAHSVKPPAGSQDEYHFRVLHLAACQALRANPPTTWTTPPSACSQPTPPPTAAWAAVGGTIFTTSNGVNLTGVTTRKATAGQACTATVPEIRVGTKTYYPLAGGAATERAECRAAAP